ncbi:MAG: DUF1800 domain-containing protein [Chloroflexi bacterium]|nr:DUF1800 domain-containing protein [Chloroflexota bacterium]
MAFTDERSRVAHLLRRAGFGYTEAELTEYTALGFQGALDRLLTPDRTDDAANEKRIADLALDLTKIESVKYEWANRMIGTRRPLQEKLALFWHTHFATASTKVDPPLLMRQQIQLFRDNGFGSFETLLQKVTRDPAMLMWLDNRLNRKKAPNENYAREVMELFTVGIGNYTETDVKEAAKAFTGYGLDKDRTFVFNKADHDAGPKTFMGETKNWDADDILAKLVRHPATARFLTSKLFQFFVNNTPSPAAIDRLSATFVASGFEVRAVLKDLFGGPEFLAAEAYHGLVKQPAELVVGALKSLEVTTYGPDVTQLMRRMGQDLLNPPDVSGWKGGSAWINSTTLFERFNYANKLATSRESGKPYFVDVKRQIQDHQLTSAEAVAAFYLDLLADGDATAEAKAALKAYLAPEGTLTLNDQTLDQKVRGLVHLTMSLPSYQLA